MITARGFWNRILHVDLSRGSARVESPGEAFYRTYIGGGCVGAYYLLKYAPPGCNPLSGDNVLVLAPSVITGSPAGNRKARRRGEVASHWWNRGL